MLCSQEGNRGRGLPLGFWLERCTVLSIASCLPMGYSSGPNGRTDSGTTDFYLIFYVRHFVFIIIIIIDDCGRRPNASMSASFATCFNYIHVLLTLRITSILPPNSSSSVHLSNIFNNCNMVDLPWTKPYCLLLNLFLNKCSIVWIIIDSILQAYRSIILCCCLPFEIPQISQAPWAFMRSL